MDYSAEQMGCPANHTRGPDIMHSFRSRGGPSLFVFSVCSKTINTGVLGKKINWRNWLLECYSDFAGEIHLFTPEARRKTRKKDTVHLYAPGCRFREDTRRARLPLRETFLLFRSGEACGLDGLAGEKSKFCSFSDPGKKVISLMLQAAEACSSRGDRAFWQVQSLFLQCVDYLLNSSIPESEDAYGIVETGAPPGDELVVQAEDFMRRYISSNIKIPDIASFLNMSESSFAHRFRKAAGVSPNTRLLEIRIDAAKSLLMKGMRLKNAAEAAGFRDEFYLSRIFKKITGVSPKDFRAGK